MRDSSVPDKIFSADRETNWDDSELIDLLMAMYGDVYGNDTKVPNKSTPGSTRPYSEL